MTLPRWVWVGRFFMCLWILFVVPSLVQVLQSGPSPDHLALALAFFAWIASWIWFWIRCIGSSQDAQTVGFVATTAIVVMFALVAPLPIGAGGVLVFAFIIAGVAFPLRRAVWVLVGLTVLQLTLMNLRFEDVNTQVSSIVNGVLVGVLGAGIRLLWLSYNELLAAREEIARLAVSEERLRFARDLHDTLGQGLAMIVLKSELAVRQLPADADDSVRQEL